MAGTIFTVGHMAFGKWALRMLGGLVEFEKRVNENGEKDAVDNADGEVAKLMEEWPWMNRVRVADADFPAWVCFLVGFLQVAGVQ